jgi:hypothetical protein
MMDDQDYGRQVARNDIHDMRDDFETDRELREYALGMAKDAKELKDQFESGEMMASPVLSNTLARILEGASEEYERLAKSMAGQVVAWKVP